MQGPLPPTQTLTLALSCPAVSCDSQPCHLVVPLPQFSPAEAIIQDSPLLAARIAVHLKNALAVPEQGSWFLESNKTLGLKCLASKASEDKRNGEKVVHFDQFDMETNHVSESPQICFATKAERERRGKVCGCASVEVDCWSPPCASHQFVPFQEGPSDG